MTNANKITVSTQADGLTLANSAQPRTLLPSHARTVLPPNYFGQLGGVIALRAHGRVSIIAPGATAPGTLTLKLQLVDSAGTRADAFTSGEMAINVVSTIADAPWILDATCCVRVVGQTASLFSFGAWTSHAVIGAPAVGSGGAGVQILPYATAPAVGTTFDATLAQRIDLVARWTVASASNSIALHSFVAEARQTQSARRDDRRSNGPLTAKGIGIESIGGRPRLSFPRQQPYAGVNEPDAENRAGILPWRYRG
jgi:hypothetical protein